MAIMPRLARLRVAGLPVHIIQRGNNRQACFFAGEDYRFFLDCLAGLTKRFKCALHAYVLMTNHMHLLLTPEFAEGPSLLMKFLGQRYVQHVNRTHRRSGSLWEGRFRSSVVQSQHFLLACHRHIELNPVRAGIVDHPGRYSWSSYAANATGMDGGLLTPHAEYVALGSDEERRRIAYRRLFPGQLETKLLREIRVSAHGGYALGNRRFRKRIEDASHRSATPRGPGRPRTKRRARAPAHT